jgi:hypothetical protein
MRSDPRQHVLGLKGLGDVINAAGLKTLDFLLCVAKGAYKNNGDAAALLVRLQATAHLIAIHARHIYVEQDQVGSLGGHGFQSQSAVGGRTDAIAALGQHFGEETQAGGGVIHHQNLSCAESVSCLRSYGPSPFQQFPKDVGMAAASSRPKEACRSRPAR